ncbi:RluA family pseudouridine synthase [Paenibacillus sp. N1-5-1-14]|uniref:RluA family pseudouridine synthase n=1 Tax=Paenibacillus radicibacter TaxID=2972488 RepID=UPI0021592CE8|nr:RluA family pseudouridine synthase [Paenibacillus radicibacter]MCR8641896.1 RluA family pseudouridine synthase [Paenibacillus radicibacter]
MSNTGERLELNDETVWNGQEEQEWIVDQTQCGDRIDKFLTECLDDVSRTQVQNWVKDGHARVKQSVVKPNYKLNAGDVVTLVIPESVETEIGPEDIPIEVVFEDSDVIVVNKPRGMVVHPAAGHPNGTLVNALLHHCKDLSGINGVMRPGIVHRIDKDTSGLLMAAKNDLSHNSLAAQLKEHSVNRKYLAIVHGDVAHEQGTIDAPIGRDPHDRKLFTVTEKNAKHAVTHFSVIERFGDSTLVELKLETGRTHQIRVHMKFIGHPLVGDPAYGGRNKHITMAGGQALHAALLGFVHPRTGAYHEFEAQLPEDMEQLLQNLRSR